VVQMAKERVSCSVLREAGGVIPAAYSSAQFSRGALKAAHHIGVYMTLQARILQQELL
jgi:hypothetical protein